MRRISKFYRGQIIVVLCILLPGCFKNLEEDVSPDRIYTMYFLIYDESVNSTLAAAVFSAYDQNGFPQVLRGSASVEFEGSELLYNRSLNEYNLLIEDNLITAGQFSYNDEQGHSFVNDVELRLLDYPSDLDSLNSSEDYSFSWIGDPVKSGEVIRLRFEDEEGTILLILEQNNEGASTISVPLQQLVIIGERTINLRMNILRILSTDEDPGVGGLIQTSVWSSIRSVVIY